MNFAKVAVVLALAAVPALQAGGLNNNRSQITFSAPVEISGHVLPAGTYVFKTLSDDRNIVVVMNGDENHLVGLFNTIGIESPTAPDETQVQLSEGTANAPEAVHAWFYPGDTLGWEFPAGPAGRR